MTAKYMSEIAPGITPAQREPEFKALLEIYVKLQPEYIVEIGSWKGGTLWHWLNNAPQGAHVVSVNLSPKQWMSPDPEFKNNVWYKWVPDGVHLHTITGNSTLPSVIARVGYICPYIDFLFLDGDHSYEGVKADFENYGGKVRPGGVIAMHDLIPPRDRPRIQVGRFFNELKMRGHRTEELYSLPNQTTMGIGVVYKS